MTSSFDTAWSVLKAPIDEHGYSNLDLPWRREQEEAAFGQWMKEQGYPEEEEYVENPDADESPFNRGGYNPPRDGHGMGVSPTGPNEEEFQQLTDKFNRQHSTTGQQGTEEHSPGGGYGDMFWDRLLLLHHEHGEEAALQYLVERGGYPPEDGPRLLAQALNPDNQMRGAGHEDAMSWPQEDGEPPNPFEKAFDLSPSRHTMGSAFDEAWDLLKELNPMSGEQGDSRDYRHAANYEKQRALHTPPHPELDRPDDEEEASPPTPSFTQPEARAPSPHPELQEEDARAKRLFGAPLPEIEKAFSLLKARRILKNWQQRATGSDMRLDELAQMPPELQHQVIQQMLESGELDPETAHSLLAGSGAPPPFESEEESAQPPAPPPAAREEPPNPYERRQHRQPPVD